MDSLFSKDSFERCVLQEEEWNNIECPNCGIKLIIEQITDYGEYKSCPICNRRHLLLRKIPIQMRGEK